MMILAAVSARDQQAFGSDTLTGVNDIDYQPAFAFTGKIDKINPTIDRPQLSPGEIKKLQAMDHGKKVRE